MKSQVIPAQITTVEDRIAGSLSLTQILILLTPVLFGSFVFAVLPPSMTLVWYKFTISLFFAFIAITLAFRVKEKLVIQWIGVFIRYNLRPKYYIFNKNNQFMRRINLPKEIARVPELAPLDEKFSRPSFSPNIAGLIQLEDLLSTGQSHIRFTTSKKGGLHVAMEKVAK